MIHKHFINFRSMKAWAIGLLLISCVCAQQPTRKPTSSSPDASTPIASSPTDAPVVASTGTPVAPVSTPTSKPTTSFVPFALPTQLPVAPLGDPTSPPIPSTLAPETSLPMTVAPTSVAPVTGMPVTPSPTEAATPAPATPTPTTAAPTTTAPTAIAPTLAPTTNAPITTAPTSAAPVTPAPVSEAPSLAPTTTPPTTKAPTTKSPTESPTDEPTGEPTSSPTDEPSEKAPEPSASPSLFPTSRRPTPNPLPTVDPVTLTKLQMTLTGLTSLDSNAIGEWEKITKLYIEEFYADQQNFRLASNVVTSISLTSQKSSSRRTRELVRRILQSSSGSVTITYDQTLVFAKGTSQTTADDVASAPFDTTQRRREYVDLLRNSDNEDLQQVTDTTDVTFPPSGGGGGLSTAAIAGIAVGGAVGLMLLMFGISKWVKYRSEKHNRYLNDGEDAPPTSINAGKDDVSTMDGYSKIRSSRESLAGYGDQSVATVDYDYSKAYGGGADHSVSSAGGTFGSNPNALGANQGLASTGFPDDGLFEPADENVREELIEIYAPAGKLGVVIDTPDDGAPVVHAIKESSVIADKLQVGDKLVAVDDEDVRTMTAIKVSKLISRKSSNPTRKLSVIRTSVVE